VVGGGKMGRVIYVIVEKQNTNATWGNGWQESKGGKQGEGDNYNL